MLHLPLAEGLSKTCSERIRLFLAQLASSILNTINLQTILYKALCDGGWNMKGLSAAPSIAACFNFLCYRPIRRTATESGGETILVAVKVEADESLVVAEIKRQDR